MQELILWCHRRLDPVSRRRSRACHYRRLQLARDRLFSLLRHFSETTRVFRALGFQSHLQSDTVFCMTARSIVKYGHIDWRNVFTRSCSEWEWYWIKGDKCFHQCAISGTCKETGYFWGDPSWLVWKRSMSDYATLWSLKGDEIASVPQG